MFNSATPLDSVDQVTDKLDLVLLMSLSSRFGGQGLIHSNSDKLRHAREPLDWHEAEAGRCIRLKFDGCVKFDNFGEIIASCVDTLVEGLAIFRQPHHRGTIRSMHAEAAFARCNG